MKTDILKRIKALEEKSDGSGVEIWEKNSDDTYTLNGAIITYEELQKRISARPKIVFIIDDI